MLIQQVPLWADAETVGPHCDFSPFMCLSKLKIFYVSKGLKSPEQPTQQSSSWISTFVCTDYVRFRWYLSPQEDFPETANQIKVVGAQARSNQPNEINMTLYKSPQTWGFNTGQRAEISSCWLPPPGGGWSKGGSESPRAAAVSRRSLKDPQKLFYSSAAAGALRLSSAIESSRSKCVTQSEINHLFRQLMLFFTAALKEEDKNKRRVLVMSPCWLSPAGALHAADTQFSFLTYSSCPGHTCKNETCLHAVT